MTDSRTAFTNQTQNTSLSDTAKEFAQTNIFIEYSIHTQSLGGK